MGTLTVKENLAFSAALRLPMSVSSQQRARKVENVIDELGLSIVANTKVCNIIDNYMVLEVDSHINLKIFNVGI